MGGIEQYVRDLILGFGETTYAEDSFTLLVQYQHVGYFGILPAHMVYTSADRSIIGRQFMRRGRLRKYWLRLHGVRPSNFDILHFPLQAVRYQLKGVTTVVSIMDILHELHPDFFSAEELYARRVAYPEATRRADRIIAISNYTAKSLTHYYKVPSKKIDVVYLAVAHRVKSHRSIDKKYLYYPAATWAHKNHIRLIQAFAKFHHRHPEYQLHLSGARKNGFEAIQDSISLLGLKDSVTHHGYVSEAEQTKIFDEASAVVFPSLFEGFGIPVLEALERGKPVACSDLEVLREVCGPAVTYFDPESVNAIARAMSAIISNPIQSAQAIEATQKNLLEYTVETMAQQTMMTYRRALTR